jgi:hypothetical protein
MGVTDFELASKIMDHYLKTGILTKDIKWVKWKNYPLRWMNTLII